LFNLVTELLFNHLVGHLFRLFTYVVKFRCSRARNFQWWRSEVYVISSRIISKCMWEEEKSEKREVYIIVYGSEEQ
jgi:hypothetical protein